MVKAGRPHLNDQTVNTTKTVNTAKNGSNCHSIKNYPNGRNRQNIAKLVRSTKTFKTVYICQKGLNCESDQIRVNGLNCQKDSIVKRPNCKRVRHCSASSTSKRVTPRVRGAQRQYLVAWSAEIRNIARKCFFTYKGSRCVWCFKGAELFKWFNYYLKMYDICVLKLSAYSCSALWIQYYSYIHNC